MTKNVRIKAMLSAEPKCPQSQDSAQNQISDLRLIARHFGLYDADDYLSQAWDKIRKTESAQLQALIDAHELCRNLHDKVDALRQAFAYESAAMRRKIYGCSPHVDQLNKVTQLLTKLVIKTRPILHDSNLTEDVHIWNEARKAHDEAYAALQPTDADRLQAANRKIKELELKLANARVGNMDAAVGS